MLVFKLILIFFLQIYMVLNIVTLWIMKPLLKTYVLIKDYTEVILVDNFKKVIFQ